MIHPRLSGDHSCEPLPRGPAQIWLIRHAQSAGNVARDAAELQGLDIVPLTSRDIDEELTGLGIRQASAVATWLDDPAHGLTPTMVISSPYRRTLHTAEIIAARLSADRFAGPLIDERLRERDLGIFERLTRNGVRARWPDEAARLMALGKFYHRPPGGESWCDVILRTRSWFACLCREFPGERIVVVSHTVVIMSICYLLERLDEATLLHLNAHHPLANCGVTHFRRVAGSAMPAGLERVCFNLKQPLAGAGQLVTTAPDCPRLVAP